jgi:integrase
MTETTKGLTDKRVERASPKENPYILWDQKVIGLGLKITPTGRKTFLVNYRFRQRLYRFKIGAFPVLTLKEARLVACDKLSMLCHGKNPAEELHEARKVPLFRDFIDIYLSEKKDLRSYKKIQGKIQLHLLPPFGNMVISSINSEDVRRMHARLSDKIPIQANAVLDVLHDMFTVGQKRGLLPRDFIDPTKDIKRNLKIGRDRFVHKSEMPALAKAIDEITQKNLFVGKLIWLYLLTGARKSELRSAEWAWVDWERKQIVVPRTKNNDLDRKTLPDKAIEVLKSLPHIADSKFIFPSQFNPNMPVSDSQVQRWWELIRTKAGLADVRLHDLRRTVASWLANSNHSFQLIGRILNHRDARSTGIYARYSDSAQSDALNAYSEKLFAEPEIESPTSPEMRKIA